MLSTASEYALRSMCCLARHVGDPQTAERVSDEAHIESEYLAKVLGTLVRAGLVRSRRGRGGGFSLAKDPSEITVLDIINRVDPLARIQPGPTTDSTPCAALVRLSRMLNEVVEDVEGRFSRMTLDRIVNGDEDPTPPVVTSAIKDHVIHT